MATDEFKHESLQDLKSIGQYLVASSILRSKTSELSSSGSLLEMSPSTATLPSGM